MKKRDEKETNLSQSTLSTIADTLLKRDFGANRETSISVVTTETSSLLSGTLPGANCFYQRVTRPVIVCSSLWFSRFVPKWFHLRTYPPQYLSWQYMIMYRCIFFYSLGKLTSYFYGHLEINVGRY